MINHGSPYNSIESAERYVKADPRFRLFSQENQGVGAARNKGIELSSGKYIAFVDADDAVVPEHLKKLYTAAEKAQADIVCCSYLTRKEGKEAIHKNAVMKRAGTYSGRKIVRCAIRDISIRSYLWNKLWRKSLFTENNIEFPNIYFEDSAIIPVLFSAAGTVAVISDATYIYTQRKGSISSVESERCVGDYIAAHNLMVDYYKSSEKKGYTGSIQFAKMKKVSVTFFWVLMRIVRKRTFAYSGRNLAKVAKFLIQKDNIKPKPRKLNTDVKTK